MGRCGSPCEKASIVPLQSHCAHVSRREYPAREGLIMVTELTSGGRTAAAVKSALCDSTLSRLTCSDWTNFRAEARGQNAVGVRDRRAQRRFTNCARSMKPEVYRNWPFGAEVWKSEASFRRPKSVRSMHLPSRREISSCSGCGSPLKRHDGLLR